MGEWLLGVGENLVAYDCRLWRITSQKESKGEVIIKAIATA